MMDSITENIGINELAVLEKLSVRATNACRYGGLHDLFSILRYYDDKKTFLSLKNCGKQSNDELISLCNKYAHINYQESPKEMAE